MNRSDHRRKAQLISRIYIQTPDGQVVHDSLSSLIKSDDSGDSILIFGPSWVGKTASLQDFVSKHPQTTKFDQDRMVKHLIIPVLYADSPPAPSGWSDETRLPRSILQAIHPLLSIGQMPGHRDRLRNFSNKCEIKLVIVDDINFILCPQSVPRSFRAVEHILSIFEKTGTKLAFAGTRDALELDLQSHLGTKYIEMKPLHDDSFEMFLTRLSTQLGGNDFEDKRVRSEIYRESGGLPGSIVELGAL